MSWYRTLSPGEHLRLEFATLLAQEMFEAAPLAQNLGRFRENQSLQEIGVVLEQGGFIEYGADGNLYFHPSRNPMTYLDGHENPILIVQEVTDRPPTRTEIRKALDQACAAIEKDNLAGHISGLLRHPIINDGIKAVEHTSDGDAEGMQRAFAMFMGPSAYLTFVAETEFEPTTRYPLLRRGIQGMFQGLVVTVTQKCGPGQIYIVGDDGTTAVINSD